MALGAWDGSGWLDRSWAGRPVDARLESRGPWQGIPSPRHGRRCGFRDWRIALAPDPLSRADLWRLPYPAPLAIVGWGR